MSLKIAITNYSKSEWERSQWVCGAGSSTEKGVFDEVTSTPSETLRAMSGMTTAEADTFMFSALVQDCLYIRVAYKSKDGTASFGAMVSNNFQLFGIGTGVTWSYMDGSGTWHDQGTNSDGKTFTAGDYDISMTPSLSRQSGSVSVVIQNKRGG